jgi:hypothetical protein
MAMNSPSTHQDSPKVPEKLWPKVILRRWSRGAPDEIKSFSTLPPGRERPPEPGAREAETYIPVSALLSDEVVDEIANLRKALKEAGEEAKELQVEAAGGEQNSSCVGEPPALDSAHAALDRLQAAIKQVGGAK